MIKLKKNRDNVYLCPVCGDLLWVTAVAEHTSLARAGDNADFEDGVWDVSTGADSTYLDRIYCNECDYLHEGAGEMEDRPAVGEPEVEDESGNQEVP